MTSDPLGQLNLTLEKTVWAHKIVYIITTFFQRVFWNKLTVHCDSRKMTKKKTQYFEKLKTKTFM